MTKASSSPAAGRTPATSRYELLVKIASGGMATVYVGRLRGAAGFWRLCAIKRAHRHLVDDAAFRRMFVAEARLASKLHHPNVVAVEDVEELGGELRLIMDYVEGASLAELLVRGREQERPLPAAAAIRIALDAAAGLHAAHQLTDEAGGPLRLVHRDVSPQNILVGLDGTSRLADFGIAKSARSSVSTTTGAIKGKVGYMAPEYIEGNDPDARSDVFGLAVVVWEALAHQKLFRGHNEIETLKRVVSAPAPPLGSVAAGVGDHLDDVLAIALAKSPADRFDSAAAFGAALETAARRGDLLGTHADVAVEVRALFSETLEARRAKIRSHVAPISAERSEARGEAEGRAENLIDDEPEEPAVAPDGTASLPAAAPDAAEALERGPSEEAERTATTFGGASTRTAIDEPIGSIAGVPRRSNVAARVTLAVVAVGIAAAIAFGLFRSPPAAAPTSNAEPEPSVVATQTTTTPTAPPIVTSPAEAAPAMSSASPASSPAPKPTLDRKPAAPAVATSRPATTTAVTAAAASPPPAVTVAPNPYAKPR